MAKHHPHTALRFACRNAEHHIVAQRERLDGGRRSGIKRLHLAAAFALCVEREPVVFGEACDRKCRVPLSQSREGLSQ